MIGPWTVSSRQILCEGDRQKVGTHLHLHPHPLRCAAPALACVQQHRAAGVLGVFRTSSRLTCISLSQASCIVRSPETSFVPKEANHRLPTFLYREPAKGLRVRRCWDLSAAARGPENLP